VLDIDVSKESVLVFDLSVGSSIVSGDIDALTETVLTRRLFGEMAHAGVQIGVGRYNEARHLYTSPAFTSGISLTEERRTIHLGMDLFAKADTPVYAPLPGSIHAFADNDTPQDYGPVLILKHQTDDGLSFYTLYGHLSKNSMDDWRVGRIIGQGEQIGSLGTAYENGGWTPHLHFQLIIDLLDLDCNFPGVCRASEREIWKCFSPDPNLILRIPPSQFPLPTISKEQTLKVRRTYIGRNLSIGYKKPVKVVRGWKQYLYDEMGHKYLDAYNNVPHVGHCHPRVVNAAQEQMMVLNTNTRYLHDFLNRYAEMLVATLPDPLQVCFFVNSGSEANELALRIARAHTGNRDIVVLEGAYHGFTNTLIDISPYKHEGPGGAGAPSWVHTVAIADIYRGLYTSTDPQAGKKYASHVQEIIEQLTKKGVKLAGFIAETCPSVGGQIIFPSGYLDEVYHQVRCAGGVCIADEVQTGYGRIGTHFYAFEAQGVVPDIVVLGKPIGNGHPIGAVITTPEIAGSFDNGMEFFSTFGGNTVSCAIGLSVLKVVLDENLQDHALQVGNYLLNGLQSLKKQYPLIRDVRGSGLFIGIELVRDHHTLEPAGDEASFICNRMREHHILIGTEGPFHNILKIRPPMPFAEEDADVLLATMDRILKSDVY
jgi:4-aminobutyrate aminotransferase-like enzyme